MLLFLRESGKAGERKLRLFGCACCRRIWHQVPDPRSRRAIEAAERFAEGEATAEELGAARRGAEAAQPDAPRQRSRSDPERSRHGG
jgi:hypothetical protein